MTKILSLLLIASVLVIGVLGFGTMNHGTGQATSCIASVVDSTTCPENIVSMSVHHIQAFVSFFNVVPSIPFIFLLALLLAVLLSIGYLFTNQQDSYLTDLISWRVQHEPERQLARPREITRWLSLFENSPSLHKIYFTISNLKKLCKQKNLKTIKTISSLIRQWQSTLSAEWKLILTTLRQVRITRVRPITFVPYTARITLQPIQ